jgi:hypothetical protein
MDLIITQYKNKKHCDSKHDGDPDRVIIKIPACKHAYENNPNPVSQVFQEIKIIGTFIYKF